jgi:tRNA modification GTPase
MSKEIIVAQATPQGRGALAVIRFSGKDVRLLLDKAVMLKSNQSLADIPSHKVCYGSFQSQSGEPIDQVICYCMDGPRSFTGEDTAEVICHNNQFIIRRIIDEVVALGGRVATRGEFAQRAVINKKIDIVQAEAIAELIHAQSEVATKISLAQVKGSLSSEINALDSLCTEISAWCQASFEFLEEERDFSLVIKSKIDLVKKKIDELLKTYSYQRIFKEGIRIALIGHVNAGKSSLLNWLVGYKRAIVNKEAGTTRDTIEVSTTIAGNNVTFIDTAGIRETENIIEKEGIDKSFSEIVKADIILFIYSKEEILADSAIMNSYDDLIKKYEDKAIVLQNKIDLYKEEEKKMYFTHDEYFLSVQREIGISFLLKVIEKKIKASYDISGMQYVINLRQYDVLVEAQKKVLLLAELLSCENILYEIVLLHMNEIQELFSDLSGKSIEHRSFDKVFREFCVGK